MRTRRVVYGPLLAMLLAGCAANTKPSAEAEIQPTNDEAAIQAALAQLDAQSQLVASQQHFCAVHTSNRLGSMGTPVLIRIDGEPVLLFCKSCQPEAASQPAATLERARSLRGQSTAPPTP